MANQIHPHRRRVLSSGEREAIVDRITSILKAKDYIPFAYLFGSFVSKESFHDVDVAIYVLDGIRLLPRKGAFGREVDTASPTLDEESQYGEPVSRTSGTAGPQAEGSVSGDPSDKSQLMSIQKQSKSRSEDEVLVRTSNPLGIELEVEVELENSCHLPVDVRVLNHAPVSFAYNVLKNSRVIIDMDVDLRADFEQSVRQGYFDLKHIRDEYLRAIRNAAI